MSLTSDNHHIHLSNCCTHLVSLDMSSVTRRWWIRKKKKKKKKKLQHWLTKFVERASLTMDSGLAHLQKIFFRINSITFTFFYFSELRLRNPTDLE